MSFKETKELETLPGVIEMLETEIGELNHAMANPDFYQKDKEEIQAQQALLGLKQSELEIAYARWESLEARQTEIGA